MDDQRKLLQTLKNFKLNSDNNLGNSDKPKILLHCCCAPCASACIEKLAPLSSVTAYFYNPNIFGESEYLKRKEELVRLAKLFNINVVSEEFVSSQFYSKIKGLESCPERGERCSVCFNLRLEKTALYCKQNNFDYFATTLTLSPLKNATIINQIGQKIAKDTGANYLTTDFKKQNGYLRSLQISKELNLYRQNYCGCEFSKR